MRADVGALRHFFVADGAGLPEAEVRAASSVLLKAIDASVDDELEGDGGDLPRGRPSYSCGAAR